MAKSRFPHPSIAALAALGFTALVVPHAAFAEAPPISRNGVQPAVKYDDGKYRTKQEAPPPALPGSQANPPSAAPPSKAVMDMQPNDALFDAINRGDLAAARDAINRGADLGAHNVLGMSPLELSVDLARNDISFLLLSMRGEDGSSSRPSSRHAPPQMAKTTQPQTAAAEHKAETRIATRRRHARQTPTEQAADRNAPASPATTPDNSHEYAGNGGGTPDPKAGFLGFNSAR